MVMREIKVAKIKDTVVEIETAEEANRLYASGEWGKPRYSERRDKYVMIRLTVKLVEEV